MSNESNDQQSSQLILKIPIISSKPFKQEHILWTNLLVIHLLKCIQQKGGHITTKATVTAIWESIRMVFFNDPLADNWNKDPINKDYRKLKLKMTSVIDSTQKDMGWGDFYGGKTSNLSGREGEQGEIHCLVRQLLTEIEDHELGLEKAKIEKEKLASITTTILDPLNPL